VRPTPPPTFTNFNQPNLSVNLARFCSVALGFARLH
jgi:hypothetical protein